MFTYPEIRGLGLLGVLKGSLRLWRGSFILICLLFSKGLVGSLCFAAQPAHDSVGMEPCATVSDFSSSIQVLDSSRSHLVEVSQYAPIPCGGWVSVGESGWVSIRHREGYTIHLGAGSFAQFPDRNSEELGVSKASQQLAGDRLILFKGQAYVAAANGMPRVRVMTVNSRVTLADSSVILIYDPESEMSQLITLSGEASFENRFQASRKVQVKAGEASDLNIKQLRVLPSNPRAIVLATLKPKFDALKIAEKEQEKASRRVVIRSERKFASADTVARTEDQMFQDSLHRSHGQRKEADRKRVGSSDEGTRGERLKLSGGKTNASSRDLASQDSASHDPASHKGIKEKVAQQSEQEREEEAEKSEIQSHLIRKLAGGQKVGEKILFPKRYHGKLGRAVVEVDDPGEKLNLKLSKEEAREKKRLIEELSQIRME